MTAQDRTAAQRPSRSQTKLDMLRAKGCTCGLDDDHGHPVGRCPLHVEPSDNRGLRAWFEAGMPRGFPQPMTCGVCGSEGLSYPNVNQMMPDREFGYRPTLICPKCSTPYLEARLRAELEANGFGYMLVNDRRVFGIGTVAA